MNFKNQIVKIIQVSLVFMFLASCSNLKFLEPFDGYHGKPKMVEEIDYNMTSLQGVEYEKCLGSSIRYYDIKGRKIKEQDYNRDGLKSLGEWNYSYDKKGNVKQITLFNLDSTIYTQQNSKYNRFGLRTRVYTESSESVTTYDIKNRIAKSHGKSSFGNGKSITKYNSEWKEIEITTFDSIGNITSRIEFDYDTKGNQIRSKFYNSQNQLYRLYNQNFNNRNDITRIEQYEIINEEQQLVKETQIKRIYDKKSNCIEERYVDQDNITTLVKRYHFTYD